MSLGFCEVGKISLSRQVHACQEDLSAPYNTEMLNIESDY